MNRIHHYFNEHMAVSTIRKPTRPNLATSPPCHNADLILAYAKGVADSKSFWFAICMFLGGLFWGGLAVLWIF